MTLWKQGEAPGEKAAEGKKAELARENIQAQILWIHNGSHG